MQKLESKPKPETTSAPDPSVALYVATDLFFWLCEEPAKVARDMTFHGKAYRRLDPTYHAWLARRMDAARRAGALDKKPDVVARWNWISDWARGQFGPSPLLDAYNNVASLKGYQPPKPLVFGTKIEYLGEDTHDEAPGFQYPKVADPTKHRYAATVSDAAVAKVDSIADKARALGWTDAELYQTRGLFIPPCGQDYGLVCLTGRDTTITEITAESIGLVGKSGIEMRFRKPDKALR